MKSFWSVVPPGSRGLLRKLKNSLVRNLQKVVNPDYEVVAIGAAIQGGVLTGEVKRRLAIGCGLRCLSVLRRWVVCLLNSSMPIPLFLLRSLKPSQRPPTISLPSKFTYCKVSGEMAQYNRTIGRFHLDGIPPAQRGMPKIEVTFDMDANGILHVSAKDQGTGKEQKIRIEASSGLTDAEIQKMKQEAQNELRS